MILKPDQGGTAGRHITVKTNIFPVSIVGEVVFHHYDVKLDPVVPMDLSHKAFNQFQAVAKKKTPTFWAVYDGKSSAFSTSLHEVNSLDVYIEQETEMVLPPIRSQSPTVSGRGRGGGRGGRGGRGGSSAGGFSSFSHESIDWKATSINKASSKYMKVTISVKKVQTVELDKLLQHTCGKIEEDSEVSTAMMTLSVYLRYLPSLLYVAVGTNFFVPDGRIPISGSGLEIWRGTHQSFKSLLSGHLGINVDLASAVFMKGGMSLIDYILEANGLRSPKEIANLSRNALLKTLNGVSVITAHRGDQKQRFRIKSISAENASELTFEREDQQITVAEYFLTQYNIKLMYPNLPLAQKANGKTSFPIECLRVVAGERFKERLSGTQTAEMIKATVQKPSDRMKVITDTVTKALKFDSNPFLKSAGIKIDSTMMSVKARVLPTPDVKFKGKKQPASEGKWELRNQKVFDAPLIASIGFVFFVKVEQKEAQGIRDTILSKWSKMGLNITGFKAPVIVSNPSNPANIKGALMSAFSQAQTLFKKRCQLIVCILDPKFKGLYEQIKVMLLCQANIISQCMLSNHVTRGEIKDQYISNVGLKVNMKMGGTNNTADTTVLNNVPTMFMGADVTHASPNSDMPSVAAVVSSFDADATKYSTYCRAQGQRVEVIESIAEITTKALTQYKKMNQKFPKRIIMFRDGVSSGQFEEVLKVEVSALEKAAKKMKCNASITYVIVQKRHNVKFFPLDNNQDRSGNCLPGTVIDQDITHPTQFNFYLQSHSGLQGTSRPTLYHVIYDQNNFSSDELQKIAYALCLLSERATRTISMVAPSYRAHFAAFYARMFIEKDKSGTARLRQLVDGMEDQQYYL